MKGVMGEKIRLLSSFSRKQDSTRVLFEPLSLMTPYFPTKELFKDDFTSNQTVRVAPPPNIQIVHLHQIQSHSTSDGLYIYIYMSTQILKPTKIQKCNPNRQLVLHFIKIIVIRAKNNYN